MIAADGITVDVVDAIASNSMYRLALLLFSIYHRVQIADCWIVVSLPALVMVVVVVTTVAGCIILLLPPI
jgi:hypothetical protein